MKENFKYCILIIAFFQAGVLRSQVYFPAEGIWDQKYHSIAWGHGGEVLWDITYYTTYRVNGDTSVNDTVFYKVLKNNDFSFYTCEIGQKVFLGETTNNLRILYDYSLQVGDTFHFNGPNYSYSQSDLVRTVSSCDSVYIGDTWRKRIAFTDFPGYGEGPTWIQGIGDVNFGGLETDYSYVSWYCNTKSIMCFYNYGIPLYGLCTIGIPESETRLSVYPNPCSDHICVDVPQALLPAELSLYSIQGIPVKRLRVSETKTIINVEDCNPGVHILYISFGDSLIMQKALILQE